MIGVPLEKAPAEGIEVDEDNARVTREFPLDEDRQLVEGANQSSRSTG